MKARRFSGLILCPGKRMLRFAPFDRRLRGSLVTDRITAVGPARALPVVGVSPLPKISPARRPSGVAAVRDPMAMWNPTEKTPGQKRPPRKFRCWASSSQKWSSTRAAMASTSSTSFPYLGILRRKKARAASSPRQSSASRAASASMVCFFSSKTARLTA